MLDDLQAGLKYRLEGGQLASPFDEKTNLYSYKLFSKSYKIRTVASVPSPRPFFVKSTTATVCIMVAVSVPQLLIACSFLVAEGIEILFSNHFGYN